MGRHLRQAAERHPDSRSAKLVKERASLLSQISTIDQRLAVIEKDNLHREFLIRDRASLVKSLQGVNNDLKGIGGSVNDWFRDIMNESLPREVFQLVLDEANNRFNGNGHKQLNILILTEKDQEDLESVKKLKATLAQYKAKLDALRHELHMEMPDITKITDNNEYLNAVKLQKTLTKFLKQL